MLITPLAFALPVFLFMLLSQYAAIAPWGNQRIFDVLSYALFLPILIALGMGLAACVGVFIFDARRHAPTLFFCAVACFAAVGGGLSLGEQYRWQKCFQLTELGRPIVQALHAYERKYHHPPDTLNVLVPEFLAAVPKTGMGVCPDFIYFTPEEGAESKVGEWSLSVSFPRPDEFTEEYFSYAPSSADSQADGLESLKRIGDWAYYRSD